MHVRNFTSKVLENYTSAFVDFFRHINSTNLNLYLWVLSSLKQE